MISRRSLLGMIAALPFMPKAASAWYHVTGSHPHTGEETIFLNGCKSAEHASRLAASDLRQGQWVRLVYRNVGDGGKWELLPERPKRKKPAA